MSSLNWVMRKAVDGTHSSDSRLRGCGVSCTRNFGLWNLYKSELDEGDIEGGPLVRCCVWLSIYIH